MIVSGGLRRKAWRRKSKLDETRARRRGGAPAYVDDFKLMMIATLAAMPLLLLMRSSSVVSYQSSVVSRTRPELTTDH
jgi:hypothetical protein